MDAEQKPNIEAIKGCVCLACGYVIDSPEDGTLLWGTWDVGGGTEEGWGTFHTECESCAILVAGIGGVA